MNNNEVKKQAENVLGRKLHCIVPFEQLMFFSDGSVHACCPSMVGGYTFGNIFENNFEEIWNGEKAQRFRQSILDGTFEFCSLEQCINSHVKYDYRFNQQPYTNKNVEMLPKMVHFNIDETCNARCIMCRDEKRYDSVNVKKYYDLIDSDFIPLLKNAETVYLNGCGELFASKLCKDLVSKITKNYPNIKFQLITNGILATEKNIRELGLYGKILSMEISMHAAKKETYDKIVRDGNFDVLMENLKFLSEMKKNGILNFLTLNFVVSSYNYQDMIEFQKLANDIGAATQFWEYRKWGMAELDKKYEEVAIFNPSHKEYSKYLEVIKNDIFNSPNCNINGVLKPL
jgi:radical SAM protein with 4Fe4S-binding SPASM domain